MWKLEMLYEWPGWILEEKSHLDLFLKEYSRIAPYQAYAALSKQAPKPLWFSPTPPPLQCQKNSLPIPYLLNLPWFSMGKKGVWAVMVSIIGTMKLMGYSSLPSDLY